MINSFQHERNPSTVSVLRGDNSKTQQFDINTAQAFGVYGKFEYKHYRVTIGKVLEDDVFLKELITGNDVSLLSYTNESRTFLYTMEKGGQPIELEYREYTDPNTGSPAVDAAYKIQLQKLAATYHPGDQKLIDAIQTGSYTDYSVSKIISLINGAQQVAYATPPPKAGRRFFIGANANFTTDHYAGDLTSDNLNGAPDYHTVVPQINLGIDAFLDKDRQAVIFRLALGASAYKVSFSNNYETGSNVSGDRGTQKLSYNATNISLTPQILVNIYNSSDLKFYINAGVYIASVKYSNKYYANIQYYATTNTTTTTDETDSFPQTRPFVYIIPVRLGFVIDNKVDIYAGYLPKSDMSGNTGTSMAASSFQGGINYLFGAK
jgi:hypothetical protein